MDIEKAKQMARELKDHYKLDDWDIDFRTHMLAGSFIIAATCYREREFHFSIPFFTVNNEVFCHDQILHEIAHVLTPRVIGYRDHHGNDWRKKCVEIGAIPFQVCEKEYSLSWKSPYILQRNGRELK